jgi:Protein of unknown function (DUF3060)
LPASPLRGQRGNRGERHGLENGSAALGFGPGRPMSFLAGGPERGTTMMNRALALLLVGAWSLPQPAAAQSALVIEGNDRDVEMSCAGRDVVVRGNDNDVELEGGCRSLTVEGDDNDVEIEIMAGGVIEVRGDDNDVEWGTTGGSGDPEIRISGSDNDVERD